MFWTWLPIAAQLAVLAVIIYKSHHLGRLIARRDAFQWRSSPPPVNAQLVLRNGDRVPVDSILSPLVTWQVVMPPGLEPAEVVGVRADEMPPFTAIQLAIK